MDRVSPPANPKIEREERLELETVSLQELTMNGMILSDIEITRVDEITKERDQAHPQ